MDEKDKEIIRLTKILETQNEEQVEILVEKAKMFNRVLELEIKVESLEKNVEKWMGIAYSESVKRGVNSDKIIALENLCSEAMGEQSKDWRNRFKKLLDSQISLDKDFLDALKEAQNRFGNKTPNKPRN